MLLQFQYQNLAYLADTAQPIDISLPIVAGKENPTCYYAKPVRYEVIRAGEFVGSVAEGGSCNYQQVTFTPPWQWHTHRVLWAYLCRERSYYRQLFKDILVHGKPYFCNT